MVLPPERTRFIGVLILSAVSVLGGITWLLRPTPVPGGAGSTSARQQAESLSHADATGLLERQQDVVAQMARFLEQRSSARQLPFERSVQRGWEELSSAHELGPIEAQLQKYFDESP